MKIVYTGSLGPATVIIGGLTLAKDVPTEVGNDRLAAAILKKPGFVAHAPQSARKAKE